MVVLPLATGATGLRRALHYQLALTASSEPPRGTGRCVYVNKPLWSCSSFMLPRESDNTTSPPHSQRHP